MTIAADVDNADGPFLRFVERICEPGNMLLYLVRPLFERLIRPAYGHV